MCPLLCACAAHLVLYGGVKLLAVDLGVQEQTNVIQLLVRERWGGWT